MKIGLGVEIRESIGEMITLSTLYGQNESVKRWTKRSVEKTHDNCAYGTSQDPSARYQNPFEVGFVLLWHFNVGSTEHGARQEWESKGRQWRQGGVG